jgi:hypothetical protein
MYDTRIAEMKREIENRLKAFLQEKGMELHVAANDNIPDKDLLVELETIEDIRLGGRKLLFEIRVVLGLLGKPWQSDMLIKGIYYTLHPYNISLCELAVLLMSIHVEEVGHVAGTKRRRRRAIMRYIVEEQVVT